LKSICLALGLSALSATAHAQSTNRVKQFVTVDSLIAQSTATPVAAESYILGVVDGMGYTTEGKCKGPSTATTPEQISDLVIAQLIFFRAKLPTSAELPGATGVTIALKALYPCDGAQ
jgi:hypothetical protein